MKITALRCHCSFTGTLQDVPGASSTIHIGFHKIQYGSKQLKSLQGFHRRITAIDPNSKMGTILSPFSMYDLESTFLAYMTLNKIDMMGFVSKMNHIDYFFVT